MLSEQNISSTSLSEDNNQHGMYQRENDSKEKARTNSDSFTDCEDVTQIQIILALRENSVNEDNVVAKCDNTEVIMNKLLQNEPIQDDMKAQITNFEDKPIQNSVSEHLSTKIKANKGIALNNTKVKKNFDGAVDRLTKALQSPISVKTETQNDPKENVITSDKAHESIAIAHSVAIDDVVYNNTTQNNKGPSGKSHDSLVVSSNTDDKVVQCPVDGNVTNHIKNENEIQCLGRVLPSQEQKYEFDASENVVTLTNIHDSSDEESSPKKSRQFTFSDSDLPNDDEIREILMMYPKPTFIEPFSESESESSSEDESNRPICRRRRNIPKPLDLKKIIEKLPEKVLTRVRKQPDRLGMEDIKNNSAILKPTYLKEQEGDIDENIIVENIKRIKTFRNQKSYSDSTTLKGVKGDGKERALRKRTVTVNKSNVHKKIKKVKTKGKNAKSKSNSNARKSAAKKIKNTKDRRKREAVSTSAAKTTTTSTRSMKKKNDAKNTQNKRVLLRNRNNQTNSKQTLRNMKVRTRLAENKERRRKRQQVAIQKTDDVVKAPIFILKKSTHEQSTVISSCSSKSPKGLKRSLVDNSYVSSPKRRRFQNTNNNKNIKNNNSKGKNTQHGHFTAFHNKELLLDKRGPYVYLEKYEPTQKQIRMLKSNWNSFGMLNRNSNSTSLKMKTRAQSAPRRSQRACQRTRVGGARR